MGTQIFHYEFALMRTPILDRKPFVALSLFLDSELRQRGKAFYLSRFELSIPIVGRGQCYTITTPKWVQAAEDEFEGLRLPGAPTRVYKKACPAALSD